MNIALMAHDKKKELMVQFCAAYKGVLAKHNLLATSATGRLVADATGLPITLFLSRAQGGHQTAQAGLPAEMPEAQDHPRRQQDQPQGRREKKGAYCAGAAQRRRQHPSGRAGKRQSRQPAAQRVGAGAKPHVAKKIGFPMDHGLPLPPLPVQAQYTAPDGKRASKQSARIVETAGPFLPIL